MTGLGAELVAAVVTEGLVSRERAEAAYGVVVLDDGTVDDAAARAAHQ